MLIAGMRTTRKAREADLLRPTRGSRHCGDICLPRWRLGQLQVLRAQLRQHPQRGLQLSSWLAASLPWLPCRPWALLQLRRWSAVTADPVTAAGCAALTLALYTWRTHVHWPVMQAISL